MLGFLIHEMLTLIIKIKQTFEMFDFTCNESRIYELGKMNF